MAAPLAPTPTGELRLEVVDAQGATIRQVKEGEVLRRDALVRFVVRAQGEDYLELLQENSRGFNSLYPATGLVWMRPAGEERIVPQAPYLHPDERPPGFNSEDDGPSTYLLVLSPAPRPVTPPGGLPELAPILAPPPYLRGPLAGEAVVVDRFSVVWGEVRSDPEVPQVGGGENATEVGAGAP